MPRPQDRAITTSRTPNGAIAVSSPYSARYIEQAKAHGARWEPKAKVWLWPADKESELTATIKDWYGVDILLYAAPPSVREAPPTSPRPSAPVLPPTTPYGSSCLVCGNAAHTERCPACRLAPICSACSAIAPCYNCIRAQSWAAPAPSFPYLRKEPLPAAPIAIEHAPSQTAALASTDQTSREARVKARMQRMADQNGR